MLISNSKSFYFKNIIINSKDPAEDYSGGVANTMDLTTGADCNGGGDDGPPEEATKCEDCHPIYKKEKDGCETKFPFLMTWGWVELFPGGPKIWTCYDGNETKRQACKDAALAKYNSCVTQYCILNN